MLPKDSRDNSSTQSSYASRAPKGSNAAPTISEPKSNEEDGFGQIILLMIRLGFLELKVTRNRSLRLVPILVVPWVLKELRSPNSTPMEPYKLFESTMEDPNGNNNSSSIFGDKIIPTDWNSFKQKDLMDGINSDTPIVHSVDINAKSMSYASAVGVCSSDQRKSQLNFCTLVVDKVFDGVNISIPRKVVEKKWSMNTSLQKEELTRIPIWVKLHDVPIQVFEEDGISLIDMYLGKPIMLDSYTSSMCILDLDGPKSVITKKMAPSDGSNGGGNRSEASSKVGSSKDANMSNITTPNPFAALGGDKEEVENDWDESVNLNILNTEASTPAYKKWISNGSICSKGSRIILGWNDDIVDVMIMAQTNQVMHVQINIRADNKALFYSFIYADNYYVDRRALWNILTAHSLYDADKPWALRECVQKMEVVDVNAIGLYFTWNQKMKGAMVLIKKPLNASSDFNAAFNLEDHSCAGYKPNIVMREFKECVQKMEVMDVNATSLHFTWNQKPKGSNGILKKIDRIMCNLPFNNDFLGSFVSFQPYRISDHSPCMLRIPKVSKPKHKQFKISNFLVYKEGFRDVVDTGNLHDRVNRLRVELDEAQKAINRNPSCLLLRDEHAYYLMAFKEASLDEERFLRQKSKIEWLNAGDSNTTYFYKIVKSNFLGLRVLPPLLMIISRVLADHKADFMVREVSDSEIKGALFSTGDDKAPGPDGFTATFFKKAWDIVSGKVTTAIRDLFSNDKLLKELNHTIISLIPKVSTPARINDYRPISCCNVLFKCISKIISNRIKGYLRDLVSINQSAFVPGHRISNNILLTQELMRNYHRKRGPLRCAFKVDIQKAYDTVDWGFLRSILVGFGFHPTMVDWIMVRVTTTSYFVCINENIHGWFNGTRGLRQGDPFSPYLFTLVMEVLTLMLQRRVQNAKDFQYHHLCEQQRIDNLCFVDDFFLFAKGHTNSIRVIMDALEEFKNASGLVLSIPKSTAFFCNVPNALKDIILSSMTFPEGTLPVRYLGVPFISSRLLYRDCKVLVKKLESRVNDWRNKFLSLAG
ncbi:hypothetical protein Tco_0493508 [Tanacetum coccineum]